MPPWSRSYEVAGMTDARPVPPTSMALLLLARALRSGFATGAEATDRVAGGRVGYELDVVRDQATVTDHYVKLPDGARRGK